MRFSILLLSLGFLVSCSPKNLIENAAIEEGHVTDRTKAGEILATLPLPPEPLPVVVYDFQDQTGQFKSNDNFADYSSAVTKGGLAVLVKALMDTGDGKWFMVAERSGLNDLLKERQIIRTMRQDYVRPDGSQLPDLPPLIYGGMLLEGGIVFYDSNILTGGAAAGYFGIAGSTQYRRDVVSVYLRAVDIKNGQVILAVNSSKTVFSYGVNASLVRYLSIDRLFEAETGFTVNEPGQLAVRQAIETAVYSLIMEGSLRGIWQFADSATGQQAVADYLKRRDFPHDDILAQKLTETPATTKSDMARPAGATSGGISSWISRQFTGQTPERIERSNMPSARKTLPSRYAPHPPQNNQ